MTWIIHKRLWDGAERVVASVPTLSLHVRTARVEQRYLGDGRYEDGDPWPARKFKTKAAAEAALARVHYCGFEEYNLKEVSQ